MRAEFPITYETREGKHGCAGRQDAGLRVQDVLLWFGSMVRVISVPG